MFKFHAGAVGKAITEKVVEAARAEFREIAEHEMAAKYSPVHAEHYGFAGKVVYGCAECVRLMPLSTAIAERAR